MPLEAQTIPTPDLEIQDLPLTQPLLTEQNNEPPHRTTSTIVKLTAPIASLACSGGATLCSIIYSVDEATLDTELADTKTIWNNPWTSVKLFGEDRTCSEVFSNWTNIGDMPCSDLISGFPVELTAKFNESCMLFYNSYCSHFNSETAEYNQHMLNDFIAGSFFTAVAAAGIVITCLEFTPYKPSNAIHTIAGRVSNCFLSLFGRSNTPAATNTTTVSYGSVAPSISPT